MFTLFHLPLPVLPIFKADFDDDVTALAGREGGFASIFPAAGLDGDGDCVLGFGLSQSGDGEEGEGECSGGKGKAHGLLLLRHVQR